MNNKIDYMPENMNSFQIRIFKSIIKSSSKVENLLISPLSIYHILSLTTNGAFGDTKKEMILNLGNKSEEEMNKNNKLIYSIVNNFKTVEFVNSIFTREKPLNTFIEKTKDYKARIDQLKDANQINKWCSDATHGLIQNIIEKITPDDIMVLINAIYFDGIWKIQFNKRFTEKREFLNCQKEKNLIYFMNSEYTYKYFENNSIQAISLDYQKDNMEGLIILPKEEYDINKYINEFNQEEYYNIINSLDNQKVKLYLPKFEIKFQTNLEEVFKELGMKLAFNPEQADFSSMIKIEKINVYINRIIHSCYIKVDEKGTKAAAITAVMTRGKMSLPGRNIIMDINHPFLFIIRNKGLPPGHDILFISKVENLNEEKIGKESRNTNTRQKERKMTDLSKLEYINISFTKPVKWYMYAIKLVLKTRENIDIRARPLGAAKAIRVVEALKKLGYISYVKYYTTTLIIDGKLLRYFIVNVKKTKDFQKFFDEREAERKKIINK